MKERPILFSAPMVRAILDGRKTVTRRIVSSKLPKGCELDGHSPNGVLCSRPIGSTGERLLPCPYGKPGDRLWVRETWQVARALRDCEGIVDDEEVYRGLLGADPRGRRFIDDWVVGYAADGADGPWRSPLFMPRWASRITLEVVSVRVERLHEVTEEDARREGVEPATLQAAGHGAFMVYVPAVGMFRNVWDAINGKRAPWSSNPWVWRVEFRRVS